MSCDCCHFKCLGGLREHAQKIGNGLCKPFLWPRREEAEIELSAGRGTKRENRMADQRGPTETELQPRSSVESLGLLDDASFSVRVIGAHSCAVYEMPGCRMEEVP